MVDPYPVPTCGRVVSEAHDFLVPAPVVLNDDLTNIGEAFAVDFGSGLKNAIARGHRCGRFRLRSWWLRYWNWIWNWFQWR
jgi:hypothetical protein